MNPKETKKLSKFLSLILRHQPETIDLSLDEGGWADVEELIQKSRLKQLELDFDKLSYIVENNDKQRFSFSPDHKKIRANQGHSLAVDLGLVAQEPPNLLFHGTATRNLNSIRQKGLIKGARHHVHLSTDQETAIKVGMRYGKPVVLKIHAGQMYGEGFEFYRSENGVWLTDSVPTQYVEFKF
ncbi:RNA 2'-phosphotransferase [Catalinimonas sp. 4WD22]|uniref:RNA 2'-phosphotransferase n=1 Tax=Catalinimonas locisalis TaxID=3133978 RepID=UPI0031018F5A